MAFLRCEADCAVVVCAGIDACVLKEAVDDVNVSVPRCRADGVVVACSGIDALVFEQAVDDDEVAVSCRAAEGVVAMQIFCTSGVKAYARVDACVLEKTVNNFEVAVVHRQPKSRLLPGRRIATFVVEQRTHHRHMASFGSIDQGRVVQRRGVDIGVT